MLSMAQEKQEHLYHLKNAMFLNVMQKPPLQRDAQALAAFLSYHKELQGRVCTNQELDERDIAKLMLLSNNV